MSRRPIVIRADVSSKIGSGHVMRCLGLAQLWQSQGGSVIFVMAQSTAAIDQYLRDERMPVVHISETSGSLADANQLAGIAKTKGAGWIVIDGYQFDETYQLNIKQSGFKLLFVDDDGRCGHYFADIVLNQNISACPDMYSRREPYTTLLLGTEYVMLRREFEFWRQWQRSFPINAARVLVTMGGSDPEALTLPLIKALATIREFDITVTAVAGGSNLRIAELQRIVSESSGQIRLLVDVGDMAAVMADSDLAVICGGGTLWEVLYMYCATITYSRPGVQDRIIEKLRSAGAVVNMGLANDYDEPQFLAALRELVPSVRRRQSLARLGRKIVDGGGSNRVLEALQRTA